MLNGKKIPPVDDYITSLEENPPAEFWSRNDSLAYFINAHNVVTVKQLRSLSVKAYES